MENQIIEVDEFGQIIEHIIIDHGNGQFTSMPKSTYEAQQAQAALSTPIVSGDAD